MLVIRCAGCKKKLWKYNKIGQGEVLRCHKSRVIQVYNKPIFDQKTNKIKCPCGSEIGIDKGTFIKMNLKSFTYSGTKQNK